jgi:hypothetical protein
VVCKIAVVLMLWSIVINVAAQVTQNETLSHRFVCKPIWLKVYRRRYGTAEVCRQGSLILRWFICPTRVKQLSDPGRIRVRPRSDTCSTQVGYVFDPGRTAV